MNNDELNETFAACFTLANLMKAAQQCSKGVRWKKQTQLFMCNRLINCTLLHTELYDGTYKPKKTELMHIMERGKPREVRPVNFRDRVVQRCLCNEVLIPVILRNMSPHSSACIEGRGLSYAFDCVTDILDSAPWDGWAVQYDFKGYFASINKDILIGKIERIIHDERIIEIIKTIISVSEQGLELGSHVSQLLATFFPDDLDRAVLELEGCVGYHRYMDDGIAVFDSKENAKAAMVSLAELAEEQDLTLNAKKTRMTSIRKPIVFCKMRFKKRDGYVSRNVRKKQTRQSIKHLKKALAKGIENEECVIASCKGYVNRGDADLTKLVNDVVISATYGGDEFDCLNEAFI